MWYPIKSGKMGNKPHKNHYSKLAHASFENNLENLKGDGRNGICDEIDGQ